MCVCAREGASVTHVHISPAKAAPDAGHGVEEREKVERGENGSPEMGCGVQVDSHQQLCQEHWELEKGGEDEGLQMVYLLRLLPAEKEK